MSVFLGSTKINNSILKIVKSGDYKLISARSQGGNIFFSDYKIKLKELRIFLGGSRFDKYENITFTEALKKIRKH